MSRVSFFHSWNNDIFSTSFFPPETFNGFDGAYRFDVKGLRNLLSLHRVAAQIQVISRGLSYIEPKFCPIIQLTHTLMFVFQLFFYFLRWEMTIKSSFGEYVVFFPTTELANPSIYFTFKFPNIYTYLRAEVRYTVHVCVHSIVQACSIILFIIRIPDTMSRFSQRSFWTKVVSQHTELEHTLNATFTNRLPEGQNRWHRYQKVG